MMMATVVMVIIAVTVVVIKTTLYDYYYSLLPSSFLLLQRKQHSIYLCISRFEYNLLVCKSQQLVLTVQLIRCNNQKTAQHYKIVFNIKII